MPTSPELVMGPLMLECGLLLPMLLSAVEEVPALPPSATVVVPIVDTDVSAAGCCGRLSVDGGGWRGCDCVVGCGAVSASLAMSVSPSIRSASASFSHGFLLRGVRSTLLLPSSRTVSGMSSMPGMGLLEVMRSTIAAKDVG